MPAGGLADFGADAFGGGEWLAGLENLHEFDGGDHAFDADVSDIWVLPERLEETLHERAELGDPGKGLLFLEYFETR